MAGRILVTGSLGMLGAAVADELLRAGYQVVGLDRREPVGPAAAPFERDDLSSCERLAASMSGCAGVVHCAAIPNPLAAPEGVVYATNVTTTANVLLAAERAGVPRVVYASSQSALGFAYSPAVIAPDRLPVDEDHTCRPVEAYGLSKLAGERFCAMVSARSPLATLVLRFPVIWSADRFAAHTRKRLDDPQQAAKSQWAYVDLRDAARGCRLALEAPLSHRHRVYNIGASWPFALGDPERTIADAYGPGVPTEVSWRAGDAVFSSARAAAELGFRASWRWHRDRIEMTGA